jgi:hypothetical protein
MNLVGQIITVVAMGLTGIQWVAASVAWWTSRRGKPAASSPPPFQGRVTVVMPSKGGQGTLERTLRAHLASDFPRMRIIVAMESEVDPGVVIVEKLAVGDDRLQWVIAGAATEGCQQNHNMIAGARAAGSTDLLAFADNDFMPQVDWLSQLVAPLSDPKITVTSGYRWVGGAGSGAYVAVNQTMYAHFALVNLISKRGLWGGSFALRKVDFETLGVETLWRTTVSDDMTLAKEVYARGMRTKLVRGLLVAADDVTMTTPEAVAWYGRQLLNARCYDKATWAAGMGVGYGLAALLLGWPIMAWGLAVLWGGSWLAWGGGVGVLFALGEMVTAVILLQCGGTRHAGFQIWGAPWWRGWQIVAWVKSAGSLSLVWAGREYDLTAAGQVMAIRRRD